MDRLQTVIMWVLIAVMVFITMHYCSPTSRKPEAAPGGQAALVQAPPPGTQPGTVPAEKPVVLGSADKSRDFRLEVTVSPIGAGIERVRLNARDYRQTPDTQDPLVLFAAVPGTPNPFATYRVKVGNNPPVDLVYQRWQVNHASDTEVELGVYLTAYKLRVRKTIRIDPKTYDVKITHTIINEADAAQDVTLDQLGPANVPNDNYQTDSRIFQGALYGHDTKKIEPAQKVEAPMTLERQGEQWIGSCAYTDPLVWFAESNRFFTALVRPLPRTTHGELPLARGGTIPTIDYLTEVHAGELVANSKALNNDRMVLGTRLTGRPVRVEAAGNPNATTELALMAFLGPKDRDLLSGETSAGGAGPQSPEYAKYDYSGVVIFSQGGMCWFFTFPVLARAILWSLDILHKVTFGNYGVAIMILVIIIRLILHPLTRYSQVNMAVMQKKMAAIQPEIEKIKKKYAKDKQQQQTELMRVYRENNVNPAGGIMGCLPMFIQMPIWIALYAGLAVDINLRQAAFIPGWISDLSNPDTLLPRPIPLVDHPLGHVPLLGMAIYGLNLLPLLLAAVFYVQMKVSQKNMPKPADEQQAQTQKISQWMIMIFPIFLYNAPSGLNLYIFASTLGGIFDTWLVRRHMREKGLLPEPAKG